MSFRRVGGLATVVQVAVCVVLIALSVELVAYWRNWQLMRDFDSDALSGEQYLIAIDETASLLQVSSLTAVITQLLGSILFIIWVYRTRANAELICAAPHRLPRAFAWAAFLPMVNWFLPPIVVDDIQRASDPSTPPNSPRLPANSTTKLVVLWWVTFVLGAMLLFTGYLFGIGPRLGGGDSTRAGTGVLFWLAGLLVQIVAALSVATILRRVSDWQTTRADSGQPPAPLPQTTNPYYPADPRFTAQPQAVSVGGRLGTVASVLLFSVLTGPALVAFAMHDYEALDKTPEDTPERDAALNTWAIPTMIGFLLLVITLLIAGVVFLCWLMRARLNIDSLDPGGSRLASGWAVGGWFLPLANLVIPAIVMSQIGRASRTQPTSASWVIWPWWLAWLGGWIAFWVGFTQTSPALLWTATVVLGLAAVLLATIIHQIDNWQAIPRQPHPEPVWPGAPASMPPMPPGRT